MTTYYRCDGNVNTSSNNRLQCSTGWLQVDEPVYSTISLEQGRELFVAFAALFVVIAVYRALGRIG